MYRSTLVGITNRPSVGQWWRFSQYILDGSHIRPSPDAMLERYDPWERFGANGPKHRGGGMLDRPYLSLIELADFLATERGNGRSASATPSLLEWCRKHGLLGLMFLEVRQLTLYPRWEPADPWEKEPWPKSVTYSRTPTAWIESGGSFAAPKAHELSRAERLQENEKLVPRDLWDPTWVEPGVLLQDPVTGKFSLQKLDLLGQYFPSVPSLEREVYKYPIPLSKDFWSLYAEDVNQFLDWICRFAGFVRAIGRYRITEPMNEEEKARVDKTEIGAAIAELQALAAQTTPTIGGIEDGDYVRYWAPTSLLGAYALMVLSDAGNGLLNVCDQCGRVFASSAGRARFCTARCRKTALQREWRERKTLREGK